ncbi:MAG: hypothetical protein ACJA1A_002604 [Saprospiraceae bacterium]|jgi:hypothetical protein
MKNLNKIITLVFTVFVFVIQANAQLSETRMADIADIKVDRFQNILDLTPSQSNQLKKETIKLLSAHGNVAASKDIIGQINVNLERYYTSLTSFKPQQLATLQLMDSLDRQSRRESYQDLMVAYGQSSDFANSVAAYNWNVVMPILVSYRKDLDRYISPADKATIIELRSKMIAKYNFIYTVREHSPSAETEIIISSIEDEILNDIKESELPDLVKKYNERIVEVRKSLKKYEDEINTDIKNIYEQFILENHKRQIESENEFLGMLGITSLLRDSFLLLLDGDSRSNSFKINALHLMSNELQITDQF